MAELIHPTFRGRIGVARRDITPPLGIRARNWGAAKHDVATGVHQPLTATVLTFASPEGGRPPLVLAALDLGWWRAKEDEAYIRAALTEEMGIPEANVLVTLSHTHAGPSLAREEADLPGGALVVPYLDRLRRALREATEEAMARAEEALLEAACGRCGLAAGRDLPEPGGSRYVCGFNPDQTADDTLLVARITDGAGRLRATLMNYACHPTTLAWENERISPDYVGEARRVVEEATGAPCAFLQGASGELAPRWQYVGDVRVAEAHGRTLGYAALSALEGMLPPGQTLRYAGAVESGAPLAVHTLEPVLDNGTLSAGVRRVPLPLKPLPSLEEIERELAQTPEGPDAERLRRKRLVRRNVGASDALSLPAWVWRLGGVSLVATPTEAYSHLQRALRKDRRAVFVANVANGWYGYLPPRSLYAHDIYPVWQTPFAEGGLERLVEACAEELGRHDA